MLWIALIVVVLLLCLAVVAVFAPVRIHLRGKGLGEVGKHWLVAGTAEVTLVTVSAGAARGVQGFLDVYLRNWRIVHISPLSKRVLDTIERRRMSLEELRSKWDELEDQVERWFNPRDILHFVLAQRRWIALEKLHGDLVYSTQDVALTGVILGQLYTLSGLLAPWGQVRVEPRWVDVASIDTNMHVVLRLYPVRIVLNAFVFAIRNVKLRKREQPAAPPAPALKTGGHHAR